MDKQQQKQYLIEMMQEDEKLGLYDEPKQTDWKDSTKTIMEAYGDNPKDFSYEEPKQETLEEVLEEYCSHKDDGNSRVFYDTQVIEILKWQQEQEKNKYSEEDLKHAFFSGCQSERRFKPRVKCWEEFIEQFKKK